MLTGFDTIPDRDEQTDGQTELLHQYRASACWRVVQHTLQRYVVTRIVRRSRMSSKIESFVREHYTTAQQNHTNSSSFRHADSWEFYLN